MKMRKIKDLWICILSDSKQLLVGVYWMSLLQYTLEEELFKGHQIRVLLSTVPHPTFLSIQASVCFQFIVFSIKSFLNSILCECVAASLTNLTLDISGTLYLEQGFNITNCSLYLAGTSHKNLQILIFRFKFNSNVNELNFDCCSFLFVCFVVESGSLIVPFDSSIALDQLILKSILLSFTSPLQVRQLLDFSNGSEISVLDLMFSDMNFESFWIVFLISSQIDILIFYSESTLVVTEYIQPGMNRCELSHRKFALSYCQFQN